MITATILAFALVLGYVVTVGFYFLLTLGIASRLPHLMVENFRLRGGYQIVNALVWLLCSAMGGFAAAVAGRAVLPWTVGSLLATGLIAVLWKNSWEARQRGLPYQMLMTVLTVIGLAAGYGLRMRVTLF